MGPGEAKVAATPKTRYPSCNRPVNLDKRGGALRPVQEGERNERTHLRQCAGGGRWVGGSRKKKVRTFGNLKREVRLFSPSPKFSSGGLRKGGDQTKKIKKTRPTFHKEGPPQPRSGGIRKKRDSQPGEIPPVDEKIRIKKTNDRGLGMSWEKAARKTVC